MQEQIDRLLKDDKIVGFEKHSFHRGMMRICHSLNTEFENYDEVAPYMVDDHQDWIEYDAIEPGIKVDNKWHFQNNIYINIDGDITTLKYGEYTLGCLLPRWGWYWGYTNEIIDILRCEDFTVMKHIGNIHDKKSETE